MSQRIQRNTQFLIPIKRFFLFSVTKCLWTVTPTEAIEKPSNTGWGEHVI